MVDIEVNISSISDDYYYNIEQIVKRKNLKLSNNKFKQNFFLEIENILIEILTENRAKSNYKDIIKHQKKNIFSSPLIPDITIKDYLERIKKYTKIDDNSIIMGLIYLDKFCNKTQIILTDYNIHRLLFTSLLIALKFGEDVFYKNTFYSQVCGVKTKILNKMEYEFACGIEFEFYVSLSIFNKFKININSD